MQGETALRNMLHSNWKRKGDCWKENKMRIERDCQISLHEGKLLSN